MNNITHPLERLKRIADPEIRKQAIENFSQEYYDERIEAGDIDNNSISEAIGLSFVWSNTPQDFDYWNQIWNLSINNQLELLPEEPSELEKVKLENEKLREFSDLLLKAYKSYNTAFPFSALDIEIDTQAKQLLNQLEK